VRRKRPSRADLGQAIRNLRQERGLTIEALAANADIHPTYLSGIERGRHNPSWERLCDLATALDVRPSDLALAAEAIAGMSPRRA
jgi:transcriptional regulator with XRE-family HTH domain